MQTDITMRPAYLGDSELPGAFAETIGFAQPARISMKDDRFNVVDENGVAVLPPSLDIQVIMLWENDTRIYYPKGDYDAANPTPPTCYSDNGKTASLGAMQPQGEPPHLCVTCPRAVWDQPTPRGNLVPACDSRYKIACLVGGAPSGKVFLLSAPPASRKAYEGYRRYLKQHHAQPYKVVTNLGYVDKAFTFGFAGWITPQVDETVMRLAATDEPAMIVNAFDKPRQAALPAPKPPEPPTLAPPVPTPPPPPAPPAAEEPIHRRPGRRPKESPGQTQQDTFGAAPAYVAAQSIPPQSFPAKGNGFGMEAPQTPPADIQARLDEAFGPR